MYEIAMGALVGAAVMKLYYLARIRWFRAEVEHFEHALHQTMFKLEQLEVKIGISEPDWNMNDYMEEDEEWEPYESSERYEA